MCYRGAQDFNFSDCIKKGLLFLLFFLLFVCSFVRLFLHADLLHAVLHLEAGLGPIHLDPELGEGRSRRGCCPATNAALRIT